MYQLKRGDWERFRKIRYLKLKKIRLEHHEMNNFFFLNNNFEISTPLRILLNIFRYQ